MKFFDLKDYYVTNFNLLNSGRMDLKDLEEMMFWEREIYVNLLLEYNRKLKEGMDSNKVDYFNEY